MRIVALRVSRLSRHIFFFYEFDVVFFKADLLADVTVCAVEHITRTAQFCSYAFRSGLTEYMKDRNENNALVQYTCKSNEGLQENNPSATLNEEITTKVTCLVFESHT